ncbi:pimeloyl-ACP methyl ester carboxylesterase [Altererythrobacter atlanticus]|uniref:Phosphoribosyl transferase n=1 Tax=Croceibacterium atlanticum TaxID=1267766 RepID=A0A0F7KTJ0_9SPHN|nr:dienelactone hydrolase family protein [Croceibacterium atlanticum]AKH42120.1 Putative phosphoribosyl transferase [Croceibacterium atlanticum]MBB5733310.1 pimeloyl-ACP methyl ester carboxylesterase [Croceibacterium atlanticum]
MTRPPPETVEVRIEPRGMAAILGIPADAGGLVVFAHGSGSGRLSPRNNHVAAGLREAGLGTLLLDLLTPEEEMDRANVFDIDPLASRLVEAVEWCDSEKQLANLPLGFFGASTGAGAALMAAARIPDRIGAVVSRGGRPDLAGSTALARVEAPTQLIVGGRDTQVIELNRQAARHLRCPHEIVIVPGAGHLFEEPGTLDQVIGHAKRWLRDHLVFGNGSK